VIGTIQLISLLRCGMFLLADGTRCCVLIVTVRPSDWLFDPLFRRMARRAGCTWANRRPANVSTSRAILAPMALSQPCTGSVGAPW
jgi:hypothetical protein